MTENDRTETSAVPATTTLTYLGWLTRPRAWTFGGIAVMAAGLAWNWDWLTAVGVAPVLISVLPCVLMCALGLCMRKSCSAESETASRNPVPPKKDM